MTDLKLKVNGLEFGGWKTARITRGIEAISGSFELGFSDRWANQEKSWPIAEEDECTLTVAGETLITGFVDRRRLSYGPEEHSLEVSGRDRAGGLVDCSAVLSTWEFRKVSLVDLAQRLCGPFGITVKLDPSVTSSPVTLNVGKGVGAVSSPGKVGRRSGLGVPKAAAKFSVDPGESVFEVLDRACRLAGVLPVSDGQGGILLTRAGTTRADTELVEGGNILGASSDFDASVRYRRYIVSGQHPGSDGFSGMQTVGIRGEATDESVRRAERVLFVRPESSVTLESAKVRAAWEAKVRAARADSVSVTVQGWQTASGALWPLNSLVRVRSRRIGVDGDMLITQTVMGLDSSGGTTTQLTLKRPDAYLPEPTITKSSAGLWKEIAGGV